MLFTSDRIVRGNLTHQYDEPGTYREVDPQRILKEVLRGRGE